MEELVKYYPLLNFVFVVVLVPIWNLAKSLKSSKDEVSELKKLNKNMTQELRILKLVLFQYLPDEAIKTYMKELMKSEKSDKEI